MESGSKNKDTLRHFWGVIFRLPGGPPGGPRCREMEDRTCTYVATDGRTPCLCFCDVFSMSCGNAGQCRCDAQRQCELFARGHHSTQRRSADSTTAAAAVLSLSRAQHALATAEYGSSLRLYCAPGRHGLNKWHLTFHRPYLLDSTSCQLSRPSARTESQVLCSNQTKQEK